MTDSIADQSPPTWSFPITEAQMRPITLADLVQSWRMAEVRVLCKGQADLADDALSVLHRLRGGMGRYLALGASDDAVDGRACSFTPPSAYAALHNDFSGPFRDGLMPKPFVPMVDPWGDDLLITLRLFGHASLWAGEFRAALCAAARVGLDRPRAEPLVLQVEGSQIETVSLPAPPTAWQRVGLDMLTPLVQRSEGQMRQGVDIQSMLSGLRLRVEGMALWHGLRPIFDLPLHKSEAARLAAQAQIAAGGQRVHVRRGGGKDTARHRAGWQGQIDLPAPNAQMMALLWLCMSCHAGADTTIGAGRFGLIVEADGAK